MKKWTDKHTTINLITNKRGESLVESIVSILVFSIVMVMITFMISVSINMTMNANRDATEWQEKSVNPAILTQYKSFPAENVIISFESSSIKKHDRSGSNDVTISHYVQTSQKEGIFAFYPITEVEEGSLK